MTLSRRVVEARARAYREQEPLYAVEEEQLETLPRAFEIGEFGRRDAEWVVRWYYRRYLGAFPGEQRRAGEKAFHENDFEDVRRVLTGVSGLDDTTAKLDSLMELAGVNVPVASAFLAFLDPENYIVVGEREWTVLRREGELVGPYPDPPSVAEYEQYLDVCRSLIERFGCELWTLYRAVWRLYGE